ncbi:hypothetical protein Tco_0915179 [Tanacetum coccineum]
MDDPNITMEEYIRLEEEKAQRHGRTFNWQTATFGKLKYYEDEDDCFTDFETEFPDIIDFRISLEESDDEDTVIFDENSFSYKIISVNDLKSDSENDNGKNNMPSSPKPTVHYLDDIECFNDFENEFPAIVYNGGLTSKLDLLIEPPVSSQHIDKFETSLSEYDDEGQNALHFGDSFPLNVIFSDNLKKIKDRDDNINITQPSRYQRHIWLWYQVDRYIKDIVHNYEHKLETIWGRSVNRVYLLDFDDLTPDMRQDLAVILRMVYTGAMGSSDTEMGLDVADTLCFQLGGVRRRMTWRQFIMALGLHTEQEMAEAGFGAYWADSDRETVPQDDNLFYLRSMDRGTFVFPDTLYGVSKPSGYDEPYGDLAETMIWYILKKTCVELIRAF